MHVGKQGLLVFGLAVVVARADRAPLAPAVSARTAVDVTVVVNEVAYDPPPGGSENAYEWVELYNAGTATVALEGYRIADARSSDEIPATQMGPGEFLVLAGGDGFLELYPGFAGALVNLGGSVGNGLGNGGDQVMLVGPDGATIDGMSYGADTGLLNPSVSDVETGHSLERAPAGADTDSAADWIDQSAPSPGRAAGDVRPTLVPTTAPPPTVLPGVRAALNEYLPAPRDVDWDGDGAAGADDEWVEIHNLGDVELDLGGWQIDDIADGGSTPYRLPDGTVLGPRGYLVVFKRDSKLALNNGSDAVRLLAPDDQVIDEAAFKDAGPDVSLARDGDGTGPWTDTLPPSPGRTNRAAGGTPGPGPVPTVDPGPAPSATVAGRETAAAPTTPAPPRSTATATSRMASPSPTPGPAVSPSITPAPRGGTAPAYLPFLVSEVMFDPALPGNDAAAEWVELHNRSDQPAMLADWSIGDRSAWDDLPSAVVAPRGFVIVAAAAAAVAGAARGEVVVVADGRIGGGLANGGDVVRLRGPTGVVADAVSYGGNLDAFDPAVPLAPPGASIERIPPDGDSDSAEDWWAQPAPSPGWAGQRQVGPPRVAINEVLPAPRNVDWDGGGSADYTDEWVELYNGAEYGVDLGGWRLARDEPGGWSHRFAPGILPAHGFRVVERAESGLALGNDADALVLVRADGVAADRVSWSRSPGYDRSWSRATDGDGAWTDAYRVTPGGPNRPPDASAARQSVLADRPPRPEGPAPFAALVDVRAIGAGVRLAVRGRVTVPPGVFGPRECYVQDDAGAVRVYLKADDASLADVPEGAAVIATGVLRDYHGERELVLARSVDLWVDDRLGVAPALPIDVATGAVGEATEGRLVRISGRVTAFRGTGLVVDDGSGEAAIVIRRGTGRRPRLEKGQPLAVVGVVGQWASRAPWLGGYRLTPRGPADFGATPGRAEARPERLPSAGRSSGGLKSPALAGSRGPLRGR